MTASTLRFGLLVVILAALALPGSASAAAPPLVHGATTVAESAPRDGVVAGGDTITIVERVENTTASPIAGLQGTLSTATPGVDIAQDTSSYPTLAAFGAAENTVPFEITLPASLPCGAVVEPLHLSGPGIDVDIPLTVRTGFDGGPSSYGRGSPTDIPNGTASITHLARLGAGGTSTIRVPSTNGGTVRGIQVRLDHLEYPLGHLRISLRAPDHSEIVLLDRRGGAAQSLDDTVIAAGGADPAQTANLSSATVRPEESLDALLGNTRAGDWKLVFAVDDSSEFGTLEDWHIDFTLADCAPRSLASLVATPTQVAPNADVLLDASGTVVDGPASYAYSTPGGFASITGGSTSQAHVTFTSRGRKTVTVTVTDAHSVVFTKDVDVVVSNPPLAVLPAPPSALTVDPIRFDASGSSDPIDHDPITYAWSVDGGAFAPGDPSGMRDVPFATPGVHHVTVRVTDADGATDEATAIVTVNSRPPVAALALGASPAVTGRQTLLDASASHDDGTIARYRWDLDGNPTNGPDGDGFEVDGGVASTRTAVFGAHGSHTVRVEVTDDADASTVASLTFDVTDAPTPGTLGATPTQPRPNTAVALSVTGASDPDGTIDHYEWDFGDGTVASTAGATTSHTFVARALRTIVVRVVDDKDAGSTTSLPLAIGGVAPSPCSRPPPTRWPGARPRTSTRPGRRMPTARSAATCGTSTATASSKFDSGLTPTADASYPNAGGLTVRVRVIDVDGNAGVASIALAVSAPPASGAAGGGSAPSGSGAGVGAGGGDQQGGGDVPSAGSAGGAAFTAALTATAIQAQKDVLRSGVVVSCRTNRRATCVLRIEARRQGRTPARTGPQRAQARDHRSGDRPHRGREAPSSEAAADEGGRQQAAPRRARERRGGRRGRVDRRRQVQVLALDPRAPALGDSSRAPARRFSGCPGRTNDEIGDLPCSSVADAPRRGVRLGPDRGARRGGPRRRHGRRVLRRAHRLRARVGQRQAARYGRVAGSGRPGAAALDARRGAEQPARVQPALGGRRRLHSRFAGRLDRRQQQGDDLYVQRGRRRLHEDHHDGYPDQRERAEAGGDHQHRHSRARQLQRQGQPRRQGGRSQRRPVPGVAVSVTGPATGSAFTDAAGCAFLGYLPAGTTYAVTASKSQYVDEDGDATPTNSSVTINDQQVATLEFKVDVAGAAQATFVSKPVDNTGASRGDVASAQWQLVMSNGSHTPARTFGAAYPTTVPTASPWKSTGDQAAIDAPQLFPFTSAYSVYAGAADCVKNSPAQNGVSDPGLLVPPGNTSLTFKQQLPALNLYATVNGARPTDSLRVKITSVTSGCASWNIVRLTSANGAALSLMGVLPDPGLPYGTYDVCVDNAPMVGSASARRVSKSSVANTALPGTTLQTGLNINTSTSTSGKCP